jgi:hypothetical protein
MALLMRDLTLVAHCTALLCSHLPEVRNMVAARRCQLADQLPTQVLEQCAELLLSLPPSTRAALLATLRRRCCDCQPGAAAAEEIDRCVLALVDASQTSLDLAGLPLSDAAASALAPRLARVRALDVRRCPLLSGTSLRSVLVQSVCCC